MIEIKLRIEGMSCQHCVMNVRRALESVEGVATAEVTIGSARVLYDETKTGPEALRQAIEEAGYHMTG
jgi:copper chaperone